MSEETESTNLLNGSEFTIPHDRRILSLAKNAALATTLRVDDLVTIILGDPTLTLHILRSGNSIKASGDKRYAGSLKTAIIRLGSQAIITLIEKLESQKYPNLSLIYPTLKQLKKRAVATSQIANILATETSQRNPEECLITGLLYNAGELFALATLGEAYTTLAATNGRAQLMYLLHINHDFELEEWSFDYLQSCGIPSSITSAISPIIQNHGSHNSTRPIVLTAIEFIDAFLEQRLARFAPGRPPPARSAVRMLSISPARYEKVFTQILELLNNLETDDSDTSRLAEGPPSTAPQEREHKISTPPQPISAPAVLRATEVDTRKKEVAHATSLPVFQSLPRNLNINGWQNLYQMITERLCRPDQFFRTAIIIRHEESATITFDPPGAGLAALPLPVPICPELDYFLKPGVEVSNPLLPSHRDSPFGGIAWGIGNCSESSFEHVFLYADCGGSRNMPPGAERIFREGLALLSRHLSKDSSLSEVVAFISV
jgi:hypothetical protein